MDRHEPEWNAENMNKRQGETTFDICGWCEFASCGSCRYDCHLDTHCSLLKSYDNNVKWDTKCKLKKLGKLDIQSIVQSKKLEIESLNRQLKATEKQIKTLKKLKFENKPPLPSHRSEDYEIGSVVYVYFEDKWNRGTVVSGYRSGDGCVSYVLDNYPASKQGWGCGSGVPCILKEWEYNYFLNNNKEFKVWLKESDRKYNGKHINIQSYINAMYKTKGE